MGDCASLMLMRGWLIWCLAPWLHVHAVCVGKCIDCGFQGIGAYARDSSRSLRWRAPVIKLNYDIVLNGAPTHEHS